MSTSRARQERKRRYGWDCQDKIEWKGWKPGGEYVKKLLLKNVSKKMQTIGYELPSTKYFGMEFPQTHKVPPGMSVTLEINFRPVVLEPYDDFVQLQCTFGAFHIPVRAIMLGRSFVAPSTHEFGFCPTHETTTGEFEVSNNGELPATFRWEIPAPFSLSPASGTLQPGERCAITVSCLPLDASVYVATAVCRVDGIEKTYDMTITGVGKIAYIAASEPTLDFGDVLTGNVVTRDVTVTNQSLVRATMSLESLDGGSDARFAITKHPGVLAPQETVTMSVTYRPATTGMFVSERFQITTPGGNTLQMTCQGSAIGPDVTISRNSFNFGDKDLADPITPKRTLRVINRSAVPAEFQILTEQKGAFDFSVTHGVIPAGAGSDGESEVPVLIAFTPVDSVNYYKRVYILVKNQAPLYIDLLGTAFSEENRPMPFKQRHVDAFRARDAAGEGKASPERTVQLTQSGAVSTWLAADDEMTGSKMYAEIFRPSTDPSRTVFMSESVVNFGMTERVGSDLQYRTLTVTNKAESKIVVSWVVQEDAGGTRSEFQVLPPQADVPAKGSFSFRIAFQPDADNTYYCRNLECFCYFKIMRNFRLVEDASFSPPWCLSTTVMGHTFRPGSEHFQPKYVLPGQGKSVLFPAVPIPGTEHQSVSLQNIGDTPMTFVMDTSQAKHCYETIPAAGIILPGGSQIVALRAKPTEAREYLAPLRCVMNYSPQRAVQIPLKSTGYIPKLALQNDGLLYFKPTCVGATSTLEYEISNPSQIATAFEWEIPRKLSKSIRVEPSAGIVRGNETLKVSVIFMPQEERKYFLRVGCKVSTAGDNRSAPPKRVFLAAVGKGSIGAISLEPSNLDFGTVRIDFTDSRRLRLTNRSECAMHYVIEVQANDAALQQSGMDKAKLEAAISVNLGAGSASRSGTLTAGSYRSIDVMFSPKVRAIHGFVLTCRYSIASSAPKQSVPTDVPACTISGIGQYPTLQITDLWSRGSEQQATESKSARWEELHLDDLNSKLSSDLTEKEIMYNDPEGPLANIADYIRDLENVPISFTPREVGTEDAWALLQFENLKKVPVEYNFKFPNEMGIEIEHWADAEEPTKERVCQAFIMDNAIFTVMPKTAVIAPGEKTTVAIGYQYMDVASACEGQHDLPVIMQISNGKQIVLNFSGTTLRPDERCMVVPRTLQLAPTGMGLREPPLQTMEIFNPGAMDARFNIDTTGLDQLCADNYDFPVLQLLKQSGTVEAGGSMLVGWKFNPLEQKEYSVDVKLNVVNGPSYDIAVTGNSFNPAVAGAAALALGQIPRVPQRQTMLEPAQLATLSMDAVDFGAVPSHSRCRQLVVIDNPTDHTIRCMWDLRHPQFGQVFDVYPPVARIAAGDRCVCRITLNADTPQVFSLHALLRVYDEYEEQMYDLAVEDAERRRQEAAEDADVSSGVAKQKQRRSVKRVSVVDAATSRQRNVNFGGTEGIEDAQGMGNSRMLSTARSTRSLISLDSLQSRSYAPSQTRSGTGLLAGDVGAGPDAIPEPVLQPPYYTWMRIKATVVGPGDEAVLDQPMAEYFVRKATAAEKKPDQYPSPQKAGVGAPLAALAEVSEGPSESMPPEMEDVQQSAAEQALQTILHDLALDDDVAGALDSAAEAPTPYFVQISGAESPQGVVAGVVAVDVPEPEVPARGGALGPKMEELMEDLMGEALFNLCAEAAHDDFSLAVVPRSVVLGE